MPELVPFSIINDQYIFNSREYDPDGALTKGAIIFSSEAALDSSVSGLMLLLNIYSSIYGKGKVSLCQATVDNVVTTLKVEK